MNLLPIVYNKRWTSLLFILHFTLQNMQPVDNIEDPEPVLSHHTENLFCTFGEEDINTTTQIVVLKHLSMYGELVPVFILQCSCACWKVRYSEQQIRISTYDWDSIIAGLLSRQPRAWRSLPRTYSISGHGNFTYYFPIAAPVIPEKKELIILLCILGAHLEMQRKIFAH